MLHSFVAARFASVSASGAAGARKAAAGLRGRARPGAVLAVSLALAAAAEGGASGRAVDDPWRGEREEQGSVHCDPIMIAYPYIAIARGDFLGDGQEIGLALWNKEEGGCDIGRKDGEGRSVQLGEGSGAWAFLGGAYFADVCRDPVSGRDHAIVHMSQGQYHDIAIWGAGRGDPEASLLRRLGRFRIWGGSVCFLDDAQLSVVRGWVEAGPDPERDGVVRWRVLDIRRKIEEAFGVAYADESVRRLSGRPERPRGDAAARSSLRSEFAVRVRGRVREMLGLSALSRPVVVWFQDEVRVGGRA